MKTSLSAIKRIENEARKLTGVISLAQGIPDSPTHQLIRDYVIKSINQNKVDKYSPINGLPQLRKLISLQLKQAGIDYDSETEIIATAGSIEGLSATFLSLFSQNDQIIIPTPTYAYYQRMCHLVKSKPIEIQLNEQKQWELNIRHIQKSINSKTKAIVITNPNNPTGTVYSKEQLIKLAELSYKHNLYLIIDSVYEHFYYQPGKIFNLITEKKYKSNIINIVSLSKHFSMTGWRLGYILSDQSLVSKILPTHDTLVNCAPVISQYAAIAALKHQQQIIQSNIKDYHLKRKIMGEALEKLSDHLDFVWPQGAYYFFPKLKNFTNSEQFCFKLLKQAKVATVPGSEFKKGGEGHFRLCFGRSKHDIQEGMRRITKFFTTS